MSDEWNKPGWNKPESEKTEVEKLSERIDRLREFVESKEFQSLETTAGVKWIFHEQLGFYEQQLKRLETETLCRDALIEMVEQFSFKTEAGELFTGGITALENAFDVLGVFEPVKPEELREFHDPLTEESPEPEDAKKESEEQAEDFRMVDGEI